MLPLAPPKKQNRGAVGAVSIGDGLFAAADLLVGGFAFAG
jgi:hypothetical protein